MCIGVEKRSAYEKQKSNKKELVASARVHVVVYADPGGRQYPDGKRIYQFSYYRLSDRS